MKKYFLMMVLALSLGVVSAPASAKKLVFRHGITTVTERVMVEEYPQYYVTYRVMPHHHRHYHHHHRVRYYYTPVYYAPEYYYYVPNREVVIQNHEYHWHWHH